MILLRQRTYSQKDFGNKEKPEKTGFLERLRSRKKSMDDSKKKRQLRAMQDQAFQQQVRMNRMMMNQAAMGTFGYPIM